MKTFATYTGQGSSADEAREQAISLAIDKVRRHVLLDESLAFKLQTSAPRLEEQSRGLGCEILWIGRTKGLQVFSSQPD